MKKTRGVSIEPIDFVLAEVWSKIEKAHKKVMKTKTIEDCDKSRKEWCQAIIEGAEILKVKQ